MTNLRVTLTITGRVQGVFYRESARREASALGLKGFVRNEPDGSVRAVAEGPPEKLDAFIAWAKKGPPSAQVENVEAARSPATGEFKGFEVARSKGGY